MSSFSVTTHREDSIDVGNCATVIMSNIVACAFSFGAPHSSHGITCLGGLACL